MLAGGGLAALLRALRRLPLLPLRAAGPLLLARDAGLRRDAARGRRQLEGGRLVARARDPEPRSAPALFLFAEQAAVLLRDPDHDRWARSPSRGASRARGSATRWWQSARTRTRRRRPGSTPSASSSRGMVDLVVPDRARRDLLRPVLRLHRPEPDLRGLRLHRGIAAGPSSAAPAPCGARSSARSCSRPSPS